MSETTIDTMRNTKTMRFFSILALVATLSGCLSGETSGGLAAGTQAADTNPSNRPPVISGSPGSTVLAGDTYSFTPSASDPDGDRLSFSISNKPGWASFDSTTGRLSGQALLGDVGTYNAIRISVSDGSANASLPSFSITVSDVMTDSPPQISGTPPAQVNAGQSYSFTPTASDADNDTLSFTVSGLPSWASFDQGTGEISGTPQAADVGTYSGISITVSDGQAQATLGPFAITVNSVAVNSPPQISGTPPAQVNAGQSYSFTPTASDSDNDTLSFTVSGLPSWAGFDQGTGEISGTPQAGDVGTYSDISITVSDGQAQATLGPFTITVQAVSLGAVTLNWTAPTQNEDGTALTDLDGYRIYWGTSPGVYPNSVTIDNETVTSYLLENLVPGTYYIVATSFNTSGVESAYSREAVKSVAAN